MKYIAIFLLAMGLNACALMQDPPAAKKLPDAAYHLNAGDTVLIRVFQDKDMNGSFKVNSQGDLAMPLLGKVNVKGLTETQAADLLAARMRQGGFLKRPSVTVELDRPRVVFVMGEVEHACAFPFMPNLTVYQAVASAGGYSYRADRKDIRIRRQTGQGAGAELHLSATEDTPVLPGDVVEIGERFF